MVLSLAGRALSAAACAALPMAAIAQDAHPAPTSTVSAAEPAAPAALPPQQPAATLPIPPEEPAAPVAPVAAAHLPFGTPVVVVVDEDLSTHERHVGDAFRVFVAEDVVVDGTVVIPKGAIGHGEVTFSTDKGGWGKGGILGIALRTLDLDSGEVQLDGRYREEGKNNDGAAAFTMFMVGIFAVAVHGKSSVIPRGRILKARTGEEIAYTPGVSAAARPFPPEPPAAAEAAAPDAPAAEPQGTETKSEEKSGSQPPSPDDRTLEISRAS